MQAGEPLHSKHRGCHPPEAPDQPAAFEAPWVLLRAELQQGMRRITDAGQKLTWVNDFDNNTAVITLPATQVELGVQHIAQWYGSRCLVVRRHGLNGPTESRARVSMLSGTSEEPHEDSCMADRGLRSGCDR